MLIKGVDVNSVDDHGNTLLIIACQCNKPQIVRYLINKGANLLLRNFKGLNALDCSRLYKFHEITDILTSYIF